MHFKMCHLKTYKKRFHIYYIVTVTTGDFIYIKASLFGKNTL